MSGIAFDTLSAAEAFEAAGIDKADIVRLENRIDALDSRLNTIQWVVGIQSAVTLATFAIVAAKLL